MDENPTLAAKRYALRCLTLRGHFSSELIEKMKEKKYPLDHIESVIEEMTALGYINDRQHLEAAVKSYLARRIGLRTIAYKLSQKGVPRDLIEEELAKYNDDAEKEAIESLITTRYKTRNLADKKDRDKVVASLARKGFPLGLILQVLRDQREQQREHE